MGIIAVSGGPQAFSSASGGKVHAYNDISTAPKVVINLNPSRTRCTFHNPGTIDIYVAPTVVIDYVTGTNIPLVPSPSALGGCFIVFQNGGTLTIEGECQVPWQAFSASGSGNFLTVMDSNIG